MPSDYSGDYRAKRVASRQLYARSWRSRQREPLVKKSTQGFLRGLAILLWDEEQDNTTEVRFW